MELADRYLLSLKRQNYSQKSVDTYAWALKDFDKCMARRAISEVRNILQSDLDTYRVDMVDRQFQPASVQVVLRSVRQFFAFLTHEQVLFVNPAAGMVLPKPPRRLLRVPGEAEVLRMMEGFDNGTPIGCRNRAILETAYGSALRVSELAHMTVGGLLLDDGTVRVLGKGAKERLVPIGSRAIHWLRRYLADVRPRLLKEPSERLWISKNGYPIGSHGVSVVVRQCAKSGGVAPISPHGLRRACATHMLDHGADPIILQQLLGHASFKHMGQYLQVSIRDVKAMHAHTRLGR